MSLIICNLFDSAGLLWPLRHLTFVCVCVDLGFDYDDDDERLCGRRVASYAIIFVAIDGKCYQKKKKANSLPGT